MIRGRRVGNEEKRERGVGGLRVRCIHINSSITNGVPCFGISTDQVYEYCITVVRYKYWIINSIDQCCINSGYPDLRAPRDRPKAKTSVLNYRLFLSGLQSTSVLLRDNVKNGLKRRAKHDRSPLQDLHPS